MIQTSEPSTSPGRADAFDRAAAVADKLEQLAERLEPSDARPLLADAAHIWMSLWRG